MARFDAGRPQIKVDPLPDGIDTIQERGEKVARAVRTDGDTRGAGRAGPDTQGLWVPRGCVL